MKDYQESQKKYIKLYNIYQRNKNQTKTLVEKLMPNIIPKEPWVYIIADFVTKLLLV